MKLLTLFSFSFLLSLSTYSQIAELEHFRNALSFFVRYDTGLNDSIPKNDANTSQFKATMENAFMDFMLKKESNNLDNIRANSIDNKTSNIIGNNNYFLSNSRRNPFLKSLENNVNYVISFYGLYDYDLSNFVSFYIQPYTIAQKEYIVYYYTLNGRGSYFVKDASSNQIVFTHEAFTINAALLKFQSIDDQHLLLVENLDDLGQRALVLETSTLPFQLINGFGGKELQGEGLSAPLIEKEIRPYLRVASNRSLNVNYGKKVEEITFDEASKTISYKMYYPSTFDTPNVVSATWKSGIFQIDDYYVGTHLNDEPMPRD